MKISSQLKDKIYFIIPAYNEGKVISKVINDIYSAGFKHIIVVNDGSSDNTLDVVNSLDLDGVILLNHEINKGQGAALRSGIKYCLKKAENCKYLVTFDSDGQHRLSDLDKFIFVLENDSCDIALGSRFLSPDSKKLVPLKKKIVLKLGIFATWILSGIWLSDTHNGYRVMNKKAASKLSLKMNGFEHASEIIDDIAKKKIRYCEVPVYIDYTDYSKAKGQSVWNGFRIFFRMLFR